MTRHLLLSTVLFCTASLAQAEDAALIVGISDYDTLRDVRGADQITEAASDLQDMGFTVYGTGASVQARLLQPGFNPGPVDGIVDADTRRAIRQYQKDRQLTFTGYPDQATVSQMLMDAFR